MIGRDPKLVVSEADDRFHPPTSDDPSWIETVWFPFWIPEQALSGSVRLWFSPNAGQQGGTIGGWRGEGEGVFGDRWSEAFTGALFLAVLWELAKHLFSNYVLNLSVYGRMYGSLLAVVFFLLWMYYSAALFLFGAALVHRLQLSRSAALLKLQEPQPETQPEAIPAEPLAMAHAESSPTLDRPSSP